MQKKFSFVIILAIVVGGFWIWYKTQPKSPHTEVPIVTPITLPVKPNFSINGQEVSLAVSQIRPMSVVVENHPDARPQAGLSEADVVYEALAEGGITRFLALYQTHNTPAIGPVRSARTYFAQLANDWEALFAHVGGNSDVLLNLKNQQYSKIVNVDEFFHGKFFQRITSRPMPHNTYTSVKRLQAFVADFSKGPWTGQTPWQFKSETPVVNPVVKQLTVDFSQKSYQVNWQYQPTTNTYLRKIAGGVDRDENNAKPIEVKNLLVQFVKTVATQTDTVGSLDMELTTQGEAMVFLDGEVIPSQWRYVNGQTKFFRLNHEEIKFNPGVIWIALVPKDRQAMVTWK